MIRFSEIFFGLAILLGVFFKVKNYPGDEFLIGLSASLLAVNYILFGFVILNKIKIQNIFQSSSYQNLSKIDILISIIGGIILGIQIFGITFLLLSLKGASFLSNIGLTLGSIVIASTIIQYLIRKKIGYKPFFFRVSIIFILLLFFKEVQINSQKTPIVKDDHILVRLMKEEKLGHDPDSIFSKVIKGQQKRVGNTDFKEGDYLTFYDNGDTASIVHYERDTVHGEYKIFGNDNRIFQTGSYDMGMPIGVHKQYYHNGLLKAYRYHDTILGAELYSKWFDLNGQIIDGVIAIKMPIRLEQDTLEAGQKFRLGFGLEHSMYETPRIYMYLIDKSLSVNDTLAIMSSDTSLIEYDIIIKEGINKYQVDLFELDGKSDTIRGSHTNEYVYIGV